MAFMLGNHLTFIDSFQFMSSSLDKLVSNLPKDDLIYTYKVFKGKRLNLMSQKGVYPYDFMDSFEKFNQMELTTKDQFYSILNNQHITDDEYDHANKVWNTFIKFKFNSFISQIQQYTFFHIYNFQNTK